MKKKLVQELREHFALMGAAYVVLVCGFVGTGLSYYWVAQYVLARDTARFDVTVQEMQGAVAQRAQVYVEALRGLGGLVTAMGTVDRRSWESYLTAMQLGRHDPGLEVVGYVEQIEPAGLPDHVMRVRRAGWENYDGPTNRVGDLLHPIALALTPDSQSVDWVGQDWGNEARHRRAMEAARDSGVLTSTGEITDRTGANRGTHAIIYFPVFAGRAWPATLEARRSTLQGFVFGFCRTERLWEALFSDRLREMVLLEMFDSERPDPPSLCYSTLPREQAGHPGRAVFERVVLLDAFNRKLCLRFRALAGFTPVLDRYLPPATFLAGMAVTILLFGIAWTQVKGRVDSERLSAELQRSEDSLRSANRQLRARMEEGLAAKKELERTLSLQSATLDSTADGILAVDLDGRLETFNQKFVEMWGVPAHVLAGRHEADWLHFAAEQTRDGEAFLRRLTEIGAAPEQESFEMIELKDGRFFERYSRPERIGGACVGRVWSFRDVSARQRAEAERAKVRLFLESLIRNTPAVAIQVYARDGRVELWNPASEQVYGFTEAEIKGERFQDKLLTPEEAKMFESQLEWTWTSQVPLAAFEWSVQRPGHPARNLYSVMFPVLDGPETTGVCSVDLDITDRKQAEARLRAMHDHLQSLIESSVDIIIATDQQGLVQDFNPAAAKAFGWSRKAMLGQPWERLFAQAEEGRSIVREVVEKGQFRGEVLARRQTGDAFEISLSASVLRGPELAAQGVMVIARDMTDRRKLEHELMRASKFDSIGRLSAGIAHDFNNILLVLIGNLSLLRLDQEMTERAAAKLDQMEKAANRGCHLTYQLLTFAKGGNPVKRAMALAEMIQDCADFALRGSSARCDIRLPGELALVEVDPGQMNQVFYNLLTNAMEAMPEGGAVLVRAENILAGSSAGLALPDRNQVHVMIADEGDGIAPEVLAKIYDPYFTTKQGRSGLGLAVVYSLVKQNGGLVEIESAPGGGTTVHLYFPAARVQEMGWAEENFLTMNSNRVLVMDDEPVIREILHSMLGLLGYEVSLAADGAEALRRHAEAKERGRPFGAILMDLSVVEGMGGKEAIARLRASDPDTPVVVSSGYSNDPVLENYRQYGFNGVVTKPYQFENLARALVELRPHQRAG